MDTTSTLDYRASAMVGGLKLTKHARVRMTERQIDDAEVVATLTETANAQIVDARSITIFGTNGVAVVLNRTMTTILTVLPRGVTPQRWRGRDEGLRGYRRDPCKRRDRSPRRSWSGHSRRWGAQ
ncbi:DUF4258 domain-containing protein [Kribbella sp. NPDC051936]|uniref:DUF4258 domain-containing protein n=1 Tax=Kribbella sp. NPDC051936 TaxID=3154946 RepID=UPI00342B9832